MVVRRVILVWILVSNCGVQSGFPEFFVDLMRKGNKLVYASSPSTQLSGSSVNYLKQTFNISSIGNDATFKWRYDDGIGTAQLQPVVEAAITDTALYLLCESSATANAPSNGNCSCQWTNMSGSCFRFVQMSTPLTVQAAAITSCKPGRLTRNYPVLQKHDGMIRNMCQYRCPLNWKQVVAGGDGPLTFYCYQFVNSSNGWRNAERDCQSRGGHLASFTDEFGVDGWNSFQQDACSSGLITDAQLSADLQAWVGLNDYADTGVTIYADYNAPVAGFTMPLAVGGLDCVRMNGSNRVRGNCGSFMPYVCQTKPYPVAVRECPVGWIEFSGHCYNLVKTGKYTFDQADSQCKALDPRSSMATFPDAAVWTQFQRYLMAMINMYEPYWGSDAGLKYFETVYIGAKCSSDGQRATCQFIGTDGTYTNVDRNNPGTGGNCMAVSKHFFNHYLWRLVDCNAQYGVACSMPVQLTTTTSTTTTTPPTSTTTTTTTLTSSTITTVAPTKTTTTTTASSPSITTTTSPAASIITTETSLLTSTSTTTPHTSTTSKIISSIISTTTTTKVQPTSATTVTSTTSVTATPTKTAPVTISTTTSTRASVPSTTSTTTVSPTSPAIRTLASTTTTLTQTKTTPITSITKSTTTQVPSITSTRLTLFTRTSNVTSSPAPLTPKIESITSTTVTTPKPITSATTKTTTTTLTSSAQTVGTSVSESIGTMAVPSTEASTETTPVTSITIAKTTTTTSPITRTTTTTAIPATNTSTKPTVATSITTTTPVIETTRVAGTSPTTEAVTKGSSTAAETATTGSSTTYKTTDSSTATTTATEGTTMITIITTEEASSTTKTPTPDMTTATAVSERDTSSEATITPVASEATILSTSATAPDTTTSIATTAGNTSNSEATQGTSTSIETPPDTSISSTTAITSTASSAANTETTTESVTNEPTISSKRNTRSATTERPPAASALPSLSGSNTVIETTAGVLSEMVLTTVVETNTNKMATASTAGTSAGTALTTTMHESTLTASGTAGASWFPVGSTTDAVSDGYIGGNSTIAEMQNTATGTWTSLIQWSTSETDEMPSRSDQNPTSTMTASIPEPLITRETRKVAITPTMVTNGSSAITGLISPTSTAHVIPVMQADTSITATDSQDPNTAITIHSQMTSTFNGATTFEKNTAMKLSGSTNMTNAPASAKSSNEEMTNPVKNRTSPLAGDAATLSTVGVYSTSKVSIPRNVTIEKISRQMTSTNETTGKTTVTNATAPASTLTSISYFIQPIIATTTRSNPLHVASTVVTEASANTSTAGDPTALMLSSDIISNVNEKAAISGSYGPMVNDLTTANVRSIAVSVSKFTSVTHFLPTIIATTTRSNPLHVASTVVTEASANTSTAGDPTALMLSSGVISNVNEIPAITPSSLRIVNDLTTANVRSAMVEKAGPYLFFTRETSQPETPVPNVGTEHTKSVHTSTIDKRNVFPTTTTFTDFSTPTPDRVRSLASSTSSTAQILPVSSTNIGYSSAKTEKGRSGIKSLLNDTTLSTGFVTPTKSNAYVTHSPLLQSDAIAETSSTASAKWTRSTSVTVPAQSVPQMTSIVTTTGTAAAITTRKIASGPSTLGTIFSKNTASAGEVSIETNAVSTWMSAATRDSEIDLGVSQWKIISSTPNVMPLPMVTNEQWSKAAPTEVLKLSTVTTAMDIATEEITQATTPIPVDPPVPSMVSSLYEHLTVMESTQLVTEEKYNLSATATTSAAALSSSGPLSSFASVAVSSGPPEEDPDDFQASTPVHTAIPKVKPPSDTTMFNAVPSHHVTLPDTTFSQITSSTAGSVETVTQIPARITELRTVDVEADDCENAPADDEECWSGTVSGQPDQVVSGLGAFTSTEPSSIATTIDVSYVQEIATAVETDVITTLSDPGYSDARTTPVPLSNSTVSNVESNEASRMVDMSLATPEPATAERETSIENGLTLIADVSVSPFINERMSEPSAAGSAPTNPTVEKILHSTTAIISSAASPVIAIADTPVAVSNEFVTVMMTSMDPVVTTVANTSNGPGVMPQTSSFWMDTSTQSHLLYEVSSMSFSKPPSDVAKEAMSTEAVISRSPEIGATTVEPYPLNEAQRIVAITSQTLGCAALISLVSASLVLILLARDFTVEGILHANEEISLICAHVLIVSFKDATSNQPVCIAAGIGLQYFFLARFSFMLLEAMQTYVVLTNVISRDGLLSKPANVALGWIAPGLITACIAIPKYPDYPSTWSCWLNMGSQELLLATLGPIMLLSWCTIVATEGASWSTHPLLPLTDANQRQAALVNAHSMTVLLALCASSWFFGVWATYAVNVYLVGVTFALNVTLGVATFAFHSMGNPKAVAYAKHLLSLIKRRRTQI